MTRVAVIQAGAVPGDVYAGLAKAELWMEKAAAAGAKLAVFPEAFLTGYPKGASFGTLLGSRSEQGRAEFARYLESAIEVPGDATRRLGAAARTHSLWHRAVLFPGWRARGQTPEAHADRS
jgi:nitrilase